MSWSAAIRVSNGLPTESMSSTNFLNFGASDGATPRMPAITLIGSGHATVATKS